jgi:monooxygenase
MSQDQMQDHFDVIIVGAGISGIGSAVHLQKNCPNKSYAILEARSAVGGTWDLFRYPGIRSDSDMYTLGFNFKPWLEEKAIAGGASIRDYLDETADENNIRDHIRFNSKVVAANWSSEDAVWHVEIENSETGEHSTCSANLVSMCSGYYSYEEGYTPDFKGIDDFKGQVVHPQQWPEDLDYSGKTVVVIGSGATAMTLVPSLAETAAHVTMVQRRSTWVASRPDVDTLHQRLRKFLPEKLAYAITRFKNSFGQQLIYARSRKDPETLRKGLVSMARQELSKEYVAEHFTPDYNPWDERLCLIPNNDLFDAINNGSVSVITNTIEGFTENGLELTGGQVVEADIVVTATGLNMLQLGGAQFSVDGAPVNFADTWFYQGMMYSDVPNLMNTFGYINASWTLRSDLNGEWMCRLIKHMDKVGKPQVTPRLRPEDAHMEPHGFVEGFSPNYLKRSVDLFPKQGDRAPWINNQNYNMDKKALRRASLNDGVLTFTDRAAATPDREAAE